MKILKCVALQNESALVAKEIPHESFRAAYAVLQEIGKFFALALRKSRIKAVSDIGERPLGNDRHAYAQGFHSG